MDELDEIQGFDPFYAYKQLENRFTGFVSRRQVIEKTETCWLNNDMTGIDPDSIDYTFDDSENTFFNENYEVKIGCIIYRMTEEGLVDLSNYEGLANNQSNSNEENQNSYNKEIDDKCFNNKRTRQSFPGANSRQELRLKVAINGANVRSAAKAKVVNFRQKNNGKWRRGRTNFAVGLLGTIFDRKCSVSLTLGRRNPYTGFKKRGELREIYRWYEPAANKRNTKKHMLGATFELSDRVTTGMVLIKP